MNRLAINEQRAMIMDDWIDYMITSERLLDYIDALRVRQKK